MSGKLYPLSSDSESEPDESESLNISWKEGKEGVGGLWGILPLSTSSHWGGGGGGKKFFEKKFAPPCPPPPTHKL